MRLSVFLSVLAFVLSVCFSGVVLAAPIQDSPPADTGPGIKVHHPDPQQQAKRLARKLQLTPEQEARVETILQNRAQQSEPLRGDGSNDARSSRSQLRAIRQDSEQQLRAVLTDSQLQQYQQLRQQAKQRHHERDSAPASSVSSGS